MDVIARENLNYEIYYKDPNSTKYAITKLLQKISNETGDDVGLIDAAIKIAIIEKLKCE
jgi:hypothetical protein